MDVETALFIGVDPGKSGGLAVIAGNGSVRAAVKMPETDRDVLDWLKQFGGARAVLEQASSSYQQGVVSAFSFGRSCGMIRMALVATEIPFDYVTPARWQKALGCRSGGDKNVTKRRAQDLFPSVRVTHAIADALLIAEYCRRVSTGQLTPDDQREVVGQHPLSKRRDGTSEGEF